MPIFHLCVSDKRELSDLNSEKKIMNEMKVKSNILREKNSEHLPWLDAEDLSFAFLVQNGLGCQFQLTWKLSIFVLKIEFSSFPPHFPQVIQQKRLFFIPHHSKRQKDGQAKYFLNFALIKELSRTTV